MKINTQCVWGCLAPFLLISLFNSYENQYKMCPRLPGSFFYWLPGPPAHSRGCSWAASGVLVGRFWAAGGWQGRLWAAAWRPPGPAEHFSGCSWGLLLEPAWFPSFFHMHIYILKYLYIHTCIIHIYMYHQTPCDSPPTRSFSEDLRDFVSAYISFAYRSKSIYTPNIFV